MSDKQKRKSSRLPCDVCGDIGAIVLPSREGPMKNFPCPQCAPLTNIASIVSMSAGLMLDRRYLEQDTYKDHVRKSLTEALTHAMVSKGHIKFKQREPDRNGDVFFNAYAALVSPATITKLEDRVAERQREVADACAKRAIQMLIDLATCEDVMRCQVFIGTAVDTIRAAIELELKAREEKPLDE